MSRILTALVVLPVLIASVWIERLAPLFVLLAATAMVLGLYEFWVLAKRRGVKADVGTGMVFAVAILVTFLLSDFGNLDLLLAVLVLFVVVTLVAALLRGAPFDGMIAGASATVLGVCYVALLGGYLIAVRMTFSMPLAAKLLSFFFLVLMAGDTGAYYTGRLFGRRKLAPEISPGKTWEGAAGGMLASLAAATLAHFWFFRELDLAWALALAAVMNVVGVIGDLTESALKRGAGAKDAANILPGHGGLLDRLDSLLFNAPILYYFAILYFQSSRG